MSELVFKNYKFYVMKIKILMNLWEKNYLSVNLILKRK